MDNGLIFPCQFSGIAGGTEEARLVERLARPSKRVGGSGGKIPGALTSRRDGKAFYAMAAEAIPLKKSVGDFEAGLPVP